MSNTTTPPSGISADNGARDPIDQSAVAAAVAKWLVTMSDEADIILEAVLLEQGVLNPEDAAYFEGEAREHGLVHIFLDDGLDTILQINADGSVMTIKG